MFAMQNNLKRWISVFSVAAAACYAPSASANLLTYGDLENNLQGWSATGNLDAAAVAHSGSGTQSALFKLGPSDGQGSSAPGSGILTYAQSLSFNSEASYTLKFWIGALALEQATFEDNWPLTVTIGGKQLSGAGGVSQNGIGDFMFNGNPEPAEDPVGGRLLWAEYLVNLDGQDLSGQGLSFNVSNTIVPFYLDQISLTCSSTTPGACAVDQGTVPEPGSLMLVGAALASCAFVGRRRRRLS